MENIPCATICLRRASGTTSERHAKKEPIVHALPPPVRQNAYKIHAIIKCTHTRARKHNNGNTHAIWGWDVRIRHRNVITLQGL